MLSKRMLVLYLISQVLNYGVGFWLAAGCFAFIASRLGHIPGMILGHIVITMIVFGLDVQWVQTEMHRPGWDGLPDQDGVFMIGSVVRIILINMALLPVSVFAMKLRRRAALKAV
jgi:hypothetical protein